MTEGPADTESTTESATEGATEGVAEGGRPPRTGDPQIDGALDQVQQLEELPVADHHDVLSPAHDQLQQALHRDHSVPTGDGS